MRCGPFTRGHLRRRHRGLLGRAGPEARRWKGPAFLKRCGDDRRTPGQGLLAKGALGKTHTQAQSDFVAGKAAFIPCGTWLASEQKDEIAAHPEFSMEFMLTPMVPGGKGDPTALNTGTED